MTLQRNATILNTLVMVLRAAAASPHDSGAEEALGSSEAAATAAAASARLLQGLSRRDINDELTRLLRMLTEAAEGASGLIISANTAGEVFDSAWRRLGLNTLDTLLIRWHTATAAAEDYDGSDVDGGWGSGEADFDDREGGIEGEGFPTMNDEGEEMFSVADG